MKLALSLLMIALMAGCSSASPPPSPPAAGPEPSTSPGDHELSLGEGRKFLLHAPPGYTKDKPHPLVVVLHGRPSNPAEIIKMTGLNQVADAHGFIAVYPDQFRGETEIAALLDYLIAKWGVDSKHMHVTGFSAGAEATYDLAERLPGRFGSVAPVSGNGGRGTKLQKPVSLLTFQGSRDRLAQAFPTTNSLWDKAAGCHDEKVTTLQLAGGTTHRYVSTCDGGAEHVVYNVTTMGHEWPAEASELIWEFFAKHPL